MSKEENLEKDKTMNETAKPADEEVMTAEQDPSASEENGEELTLEAQLEAAKAEAAQNLDGWQRARAEMANAKKRYDRQAQASYTNATVDVVKKLLPVMDDFERALDNVPAEIAENSWFDGLSGVMRKMNHILEGINAERIPSVGEAFDPNVHEALSMEASDEYESGVVVKELQAGYRIGDRVIRPALVFVAE